MAEPKKPITPAAPRSDFDAGDSGATVVSSGFHRSPGTSSGRMGQAPTSTPAGTSGINATFHDRAPRARMSVPVRYRYQSFIDFVETQSVNVSRSGMFVSSDSPLPVGTSVQFEFSLADGFVILRGTGEVVRVVQGQGFAARGMGLRFTELEDKTRKLIERIIAVNSEEGKEPTVPLEQILAASSAGAPSPLAQQAAPTPPRNSSGFNAIPTSGGAPTSTPSSTAVASAVRWGNKTLHVVLNTATVGFFVHNPLLNIKMGGFVVPADQDAPLGAIYDVQILDLSGTPIVACKGKVVAKQEKRLGLRLQDADKTAMKKLSDDVGRLASAK